jgi:beta-phosphoglucomutase family hydrolase
MALTVDPKVRGLIFDFDGTLGDTMPTHAKAWQAVGAQFGFQMPTSLLYELAGMTTENIIQYLNRKFGYDLDFKAVNQAKKEVYLHLATKITPIEPVFRIVREYYGKLPMALGTGEYRDIALNNVKAAGVERYFEIIVTADDVKKGKPDPETFLKCAELMKIPPQFCQVFEDAPPGLEAAAKAGMIATDVRPFYQEAV